MSTEVGARVGAILSSGEGSIKILGYGVRLADQIPDPALNVKLYGRSVDSPNPCIRLDSGKLVFGCECWWGSEIDVRKIVEKFGDVYPVDIETERLVSGTTHSDVMDTATIREVAAQLGEQAAYYAVEGSPEASAAYAHTAATIAELALDEEERLQQSQPQNVPAESPADGWLR